MKIKYFSKILFCALFTLILFSCIEKNTNKKVDLNNKVKIIDKIKTDSKKEYGFLVLKDDYQQKKLITIFNEDKSKWKDFVLNDSYSENEEISPHYIKPEYKKLIFNCLEKKNGYYAIIVNEEKKL